MDILKEIICLCMNGCDIEAIFRDFPSEKRREYLQYTKLLWENHILVEMLPEHQCLDAGLLGLILGNFDGNPELIRFWLKTPIYCAGVTEWSVLCRICAGHCATGALPLCGQIF